MSWLAKLARSPRVQHALAQEAEKLVGQAHDSIEMLAVLEHSMKRLAAIREVELGLHRDFIIMHSSERRLGRRRV